MAAKAILDHDYIKYILERLEAPWWREVILLAVGGIGGRNKTSELLRTIFEHTSQGVDNLILAAECAKDVGETRIDPRLRNEIVDRLSFEMTNERNSLEKRVEIGNLLGRIGDSRFKGRFLEPEMIKVPWGYFEMGSDENDTFSDSSEKPQHDVLVATFWIARYPITNAQYYRFIEAGGYDRREFWSVHGWKWREGINILEDTGEEDRAPTWSGGGALVYTRDYWLERGLRFPNHPVVYTTWYEALAYCRWLASETNKSYRLPTEAEWEKAARGTHGRIYSWGNKFDDTQCNTDECGVGSTTPVGLFLSGSSPYGILEMCGNSREWVSTVYAAYPYNYANDNVENLETDETRVLRNGSWLNDRRAARCTYRYPSPPDLFPDVNGFRVALSDH